MPSIPGDLVGRARRQVVDDLRTDPYLRYVLVLAAVLCAFWFWHRIPNFATRDEKSRLFDVVVAYGRVIDEPSIGALQEGVTWGRVPFGATFYVFGLAVAPVVLAAGGLGQLDAFATFGFPGAEFGGYPAWQSMPRWVWTWSLAFVRLFAVAFAVGSVYLTYRLGTAAYDRRTGNLAALLVTLTFGFLTIAHEGGEDMPALFFVLLSAYLLLRYVQTADRALFLTGCAAGGVAIAFKLTAVPVVLLAGVAFLLRARHVADPAEALARPRLFLGGAAAGLVCIALGFPTLLVGGVEPVLARFLEGAAARADHPTGPDAPIWWWFLRGYVSALSLPLTVAGAGGVLAGVLSLRRRVRGVDGTVLVLTALAGFLLLFSQWHDFRVHHLLPTFPLVALLLADGLVRLDRRRPALARPIVAVLLVTSGTYAVAGDLGYASMPRDRAEAWLVEEADADATMEVYRRDFHDAAVPFGMDVQHAYGPETGDETLEPCPRYIQLGYRDLLYLDPGTYYRNGPERAAYVGDLLRGEYNYEVVREFGPRPPSFVPERPTPGSLSDLVRHGIVPQTDQYADEQELRENQYTAILELRGPCPPDRYPPPF